MFSALLIHKTRCVLLYHSRAGGEGGGGFGCEHFMSVQDVQIQKYGNIHCMTELTMIVPLLLLLRVTFVAHMLKGHHSLKHLVLVHANYGMCSY